MAENNKKRFEFSEDKKKIRASQGHSIEGIELGYAAQVPPTILYHGTTYPIATDHILSNRDENGIRRGQRHMVHLTDDLELAMKIGRRHNSEKAAVVVVAALRMWDEGHPFFRSTNGVWLTERVPREFCTLG